MQEGTIVFRFLAVLLFLPAVALAQEFPVAPPPRAVAPLPAVTEKAIRSAVYEHGLLVGSRFDGGFPTQEVAVPNAITEAYSKHPTSVLALLMKIAHGAEPRDSVKAVAYAISLLDG